MGNKNVKPTLPEACYSEIYYRLGTAQLKRENYTEALKSYSKSVELDPHNFESLNSLGDILNTQEDYDGASINYQNALSVNSNSSIVHSNLGDTLYNQEKYDEAVAHYQRALQLSPNDSKVYSSCGDALYRQKYYKEAARYYNKSIRLNSNDSNIFSSLGQALSKLGEYDQATRQYQRAIRIDPKDSSIYTNLAKTLSKQGKMDESINQHLKALELDPENIESSAKLGLILSSQGRYEEAIKYYYKAIELGLKDANIHRHLGLSLYCLGKYEKAIGQYLKAIQIMPDCYMTLFSWSLSLFSMERYIEYFRAFANALYVLEDLLVEKTKIIKHFTVIKSFLQGKISEALEEDNSCLVGFQSRIDAIDHILGFLTADIDKSSRNNIKLKIMDDELHSTNLKILEIGTYFYSKRYHNKLHQSLQSIFYMQEIPFLESLEEMPFPDYKAVCKINRPDKIYSVMARLGLREVFSDDRVIIGEQNQRYSQLIMSFTDPSLVTKLIRSLADELTILRRERIYADFTKDYSPKNVKKEKFRQIISSEGDIEKTFAACAFSDMDIFALACFFEYGVEIPDQIDGEQDVNIFVGNAVNKMKKYIDEIIAYDKKAFDNLSVISPSKAI